MSEVDTYIKENAEVHQFAAEVARIISGIPQMPEFSSESMSVSGETNLIGFHTQGNYHTAVSEAFAVMGLTLFAEYIDAIAVITIDETPTLGTLTVTSAEGTATGDTKITVNPAKENSNNVYKYKVGASETAVTYGQNLRNWTSWDGKADIKATTGQKITVVECDGTYKALNAGSASVTAKS